VRMASNTAYCTTVHTRDLATVCKLITVVAAAAAATTTTASE